MSTPKKWPNSHLREYKETRERTAPKILIYKEVVSIIRKMLILADTPLHTRALGS